MESVGGFGQLIDLIPYQLPPVPSYAEDVEVLYRPQGIEAIVALPSNETESASDLETPIGEFSFDWNFDVINIDLPLSTEPFSYGETTTTKPQWNTSTTTIYTPGNNKLEQSIAVKEVADQFMMASGTVIGITAGIFMAAQTGKPQIILSGATKGKDAGATVGGWMWSIING